jgi:hypothetical protein
VPLWSRYDTDPGRTAGFRSRLVAAASGASVLRDQGPIGRPGTARPIKAWASQPTSTTAKAGRRRTDLWAPCGIFASSMAPSSIKRCATCLSCSWGLEQRGWLDRRLWLLRKSDPVTAASLDRLEVTSLWSQRPTLKHPPGFYLMPEPWGGWEQGSQAPPTFVSDLLAEPHMARLRRQLADAEVDERHAFLFSGRNIWSPCCWTRERPASFRRLRPSSQNRSMGYGLQPLGYDTSPRLGSS